MLTKKSEILAKQSLNAMYKDSIGASKQERIIKVFGSLWLPLAIISVMISTFSIYMDLTLPLGFALSLTIGFIFASILVVFSHYALDSLFTTFTGLSKILMGVIFFGLASLSIITHFKSLNNLEKIMVQDKRVEILRNNMNESDEANRQIKEVLATNLALTKVFNNGTIHDDKQAMRSISSNNKLIHLLKNTGSQKEINQEIIQSEKELAESLKNTLLLLFIIFEILSYFSVVSKILLALNTSDEVKNLTTHLSKLEDIQANVYGAVLENKSREIEAELIGATQTVNQPTYPTLSLQRRVITKPNTDNISNQSIKREIDECFDILNDECEETPINRTSTESAHGGTDYTKTTENNINTNDSEKIQSRFIDLSSYEFRETEMLKVMFDNGSVNKVGDKLIPKRFVLAQTKADKKEYENLTSSLEDAGYIYIKAGSGWVSNCRGIKTVVAIQE